MTVELHSVPVTDFTPSGPSRDEDRQLALAASTGNRNAQRQIVQRLLPKLRGLIGATVRDRVLTDDLTQDAIVKVLESLKDYRGESSLDFWATRIGIRMAYRNIRSRFRRSQLLFFLPEPRSPFAETDAGASESGLRVHLLRLLSKLPEKQQMALMLRHVNELSIGEIAELEEIPENTVRDRLRAGKKRFRELLEKNPELAGAIDGGLQ